MGENWHNFSIISVDRRIITSKGDILTMQRSLLLFENAIKSEYTKKVYYGHLKKFLEFVPKESNKNEKLSHDD
jgi:hypothetical protein